MDRRGWLWKKKPSDKNTNAEKPVAVSEPVASNMSSIAHLGDQVWFFYVHERISRLLLAKFLTSHQVKSCSISFPWK